MDAFLHQLLDQPPWLIYLATGLIVFLEDALFFGFVIPGETVAILGGVSASLGHTDLAAMIVLVVLAAIVGDSVGYEVGKILGPRLLDNRLLRSRRHQIDKAQDFLKRRGAPAVFLGRWTAFFRAMMPALAGASHMPYRIFLPWNAIGGIAWGVTCVVAGHIAGQSYQRVATWLGAGAAGVIAVIVLVALVVWHVRRRRAERSAEADPLDAAELTEPSGPSPIS